MLWGFIRNLILQVCLSPQFLRLLYPSLQALLLRKNLPQRKQRQKCRFLHMLCEPSYSSMSGAKCMSADKINCTSVHAFFFLACPFSKAMRIWSHPHLLLQLPALLLVLFEQTKWSPFQQRWSLPLLCKWTFQNPQALQLKKFLSRQNWRKKVLCPHMQGKFICKP